MHGLIYHIRIPFFLLPAEAFCPARKLLVIKTFQTSLSYLMKFTIKDIPADASAQPSPV